MGTEGIIRRENVNEIMEKRKGERERGNREGGRKRGKKQTEEFSRHLNFSDSNNSSKCMVQRKHLRVDKHRESWMTANTLRWFKL